VADFYRGTLSARRLSVLLRELPRHSRLMARLSGDDEAHRWGYPEHLMATMADQLQQLVRLTVGIATQGKKKPPRFEAYPRPGAHSRRKDAERQRDSLAFEHLRQLAPGGPVSRGEPLRSPLRVVTTRDDVGQRDGPATWEDAG
jgi:hypothetical protein